MSETNKIKPQIQFSHMEVAVILTSWAVLTLCLSYVLFAYTPLHDMIPGYPTADVQRQQIQNAMRIDSLEKSITRWELYSENLRNVIRGEAPATVEEIYSAADRAFENRDIMALASNDSTLRAKVDEAEKFEIRDKNMRNLQIEGLRFFPPVSGTLSLSFDNALSPYVEIDAQQGSAVSAVLDGHIVYTEWSEAYGWSAVMQHDDGIISIYRNNQKLLKNAGDNVSAGTAIGLLGGSSLSDHCSLRFELWQNGTPLDPAIYINF